MYVREWALSQWEEKTQVSLAEELPQLKALILETREREARLAAEEVARLAAEEEAALAASFENPTYAGHGTGRRRA